MQSHVSKSFATLWLLLASCGQTPIAPVRTWTPADHTGPQGEATQGEAQDTASAASPALSIWRLSCSSCHGLDGRGAAGQAVPDLTTSTWQDATTDEAIASVIRTGRGAMPPFAETLSDSGIVALVAHIRTLRR